MKKSTFLPTLVPCLILLTMLTAQSLYAQNGVGIEVTNPQEMLDVNGAIKVGTDFNNTTGAPQGGAGTIRWNGTNFEGWDGTQWIQFGGSGFSNLLQDADTDTKVQVEESPDEDLIRFDVAGTEYFRMEAGRVRVTNTNWNVFYGDDAGELTGTGERNTAFGTGVLRSLTNGAYNTAIGDRPLLNLTDGSYNVGMGSRTMNNKVSGDHNIAFGRDVMWYNTTGSKNIAIGSYALTANNGDQNIAIGFDAGYNNTGSGNVFLGTSAGRNSSGSNKLYIDNTNTNSPLIYGEFDNDIVGINGQVAVGHQSPNANLDVIGSNSGSTALALRSGDNWNSFDSNQMTFAYDGSQNYRHSIRTRHYASGKQYNAFDFYVWNQGVDAIGDIGSKRVMTIDGRDQGMVGIGTGEPLDELHVVGSIRMVDGNQQAGRIPISNANGTMVWTDPAAINDGDWTINGNDQYSAVSGNVGIGTNTPDAKLQVVGTAIVGANNQTVTGTQAAIGAGVGNSVAANYAFAAGYQNTVTSGGTYSAVFGRENTTSAGATFIAGSDKGSVGSTNSAIVGGFRDTISTGSSNSVIAGGENNSISADRSFIGAGINNTVSGVYSAAFGANNTVTAGRGLVSGSGNTVSNIYSVAFGQNNSVGGQKSLVGGQFSHMEQGNNSQSFVWGLRDTLSGSQSAISGGENNTIMADEAFIGAGISNSITSRGGFIGAGNSNSVSGVNGAAFGQNNTAASYGEFVIGTNATEYVPVSTTSYNANDRVFAVGNGNNTSNRSNALTVYKNGTVNINDAYNLPTADGTNGYVMVTNGSGAVSWTDPTTISTADDGDWTINGNDQYSAVSGNVGIGSNSPSELLHLRKDGFDNYIRIDAASPNSGYAGIRLAEPSYNYGWYMRFNAAPAGGLHFAFNDNANTYDRMTILPNGNVGIGTTAASAALHVVPTSANGPTATFETGSNQYPVSLRILPTSHATSERASIQVDDWHILQDRTGGGIKDFAIWQQSTALQRFNIDASGNIGIGDETPDAKLDVAGQIQMETGAAAGYIPVSDANGTMTWTDPTTISTAPVSELVDADNDTKIQVEESTDEDLIRFDVAGTEYFRMEAGRIQVSNTGESVSIGSNAGSNDDFSNNRNVAIGSSAGRLTTTGENNVAIGRDALRYNTTGSLNVALGNYALRSNTTANANVALGNYAMYATTTGEANVAIGSGPLRSNETGGWNYAIGNDALYDNVSGSYNVAIGREAGRYTLGSRNVFIGDRAGHYETGSDRLYIDNSNSGFPLVYGEFDNDIVAINGNLGIGVQSPSHNLTVNGSLSDATPILGLLSGNASTAFNNGAQIAFGYNGNPVYQHFIQTRHNSSVANNAIDFYVSDGTLNNTLVSGSTHVMSLNAGNVGIGTTTPMNKLSLGTTVGSSATDVAGKKLAVYNNAAGTDFYGLGISTNTLQFHAQSAAAEAPDMVLLANGNVGMGVVAPQHKLQLANSGIQSGFSVDLGATGSSIIYKDYGAATNDLHFIYEDQTNAQTEVMTLVGNGNTGYLGIGETSPQDELHVAGSIRMVDGNQAAGYIPVSDANGTMTWTDPTTITTADDGDWTVSGTDQYSSVSGNVGIGTTAPADKLHLKVNNAGFNTPLLLHNGSNATTNNAVGLAFANEVNNVFKAAIVHQRTGGWGMGDMHFVLDNVSDNVNADLTDTKMTLTKDGNLGIGITAPAASLDIEGDSYGTTSLLLRSGNGNTIYTSNQISFGYNGSATYQHAIKSRHNASGDDKNAIDFFVWDNGTDATTTVGTKHVMTIDGNGGGMVGVNTTDPAEELHVQGSIRMVDGNQAAGYIPVSDANGTMTWTDPTTVTTADDGDWTVSGSNQYSAVSGNVGIGTATPQQKLHVSASQASGLSLPVLISNPAASNSAGAGSGIGFVNHNAGTAAKAAIYNERVTNYGLGKMHFMMSNTADNTEVSVSTDSRMTILSNGNVGVGNTAPSAKLDVTGDIKVNTYGIQFTDTENGNATVELRASDPTYPDAGVTLRTLSNPANGEPIFRVMSSGGAERLRVEHNGAVAMNNTIRIEGGSPGSNKVLQSTDNSGNAVWGPEIFQGSGNNGYQVIGNLVIAWGRTNSNTDDNQYVTFPSTWPTMSAVYHVDAQVITGDDSTGRIVGYGTNYLIYNRDDSVSGSTESLQYMVIGWR